MAFTGGTGSREEVLRVGDGLRWAPVVEVVDGMFWWRGVTYWVVVALDDSVSSEGGGRGS